MESENKVVAQIIKKVSELTVDDIAIYCSENGITMGSLCFKLKQLLNAEREIKNKYGDVLDSVPDNNVQLKALTVALELLKLVGGKQVEIKGEILHRTVPAEDLPKMQLIVAEMNRLSRAIEENPIQQGIEDATIRDVSGQ